MEITNNEWFELVEYIRKLSTYETDDGQDLILVSDVLILLETLKEGGFVNGDSE